MSENGNKCMKNLERVLTISLAALGILGAAPPHAVAAEPILPQQLNPLLALIRPRPGEEKWQQIPWMINLWEARTKAAAQGKPILLWEMDGHPLACT
jgi:hypothetical protein